MDTPTVRIAPQNVAQKNEDVKTRRDRMLVRTKVRNGEPDALTTVGSITYAAVQPRNTVNLTKSSGCDG